MKRSTFPSNKSLPHFHYPQSYLSEPHNMRSQSLCIQLASIFYHLDIHHLFHSIYFFFSCTYNTTKPRWQTIEFRLDVETHIIQYPINKQDNPRTTEPIDKRFKMHVKTTSKLVWNLWIQIADYLATNRKPPEGTQATGRGNNMISKITRQL